MVWYLPIYIIFGTFSSYNTKEIYYLIVDFFDFYSYKNTNRLINNKVYKI